MTSGGFRIVSDTLVSATFKASNFYFGTQVGFLTSLPKQRLGPKLEWLLAWEHQKNLGPLLISVTVEDSNFKFGTQLGFGTSLPKNNVLGPN